LAPSDVEIIVLRQLASCLRIPIAILGPRANVVFFNEPAESIFGYRFEELGGLEAEEWSAVLAPSDEDGAPLKDEQRPVLVAVESRVPSHRRIFIQGPDRLRREIELTAVPLIARADPNDPDGDVGERFLGALVLFWGRERHSDPRAGETEAGRPVELVLTQRLASHLATPIFVVDADGRLAYANASAQAFLGGGEDGSGRISRRQLYEAFRPRDAEGNPIAPDEHPLVVARLRNEPIHARSRIRGRDGVEIEIAVTAIPLIGQSDRQLGALGIFWEIGKS